MARYTARELIHEFCQPSGKYLDARSGNLSCMNGALYSYRAKIAQWVTHPSDELGDVLLVSDASYSVTTSKHQNWVIASIPDGVVYYRTDRLLSLLPPDWPGICSKLWEGWLQEFDRRVSALSGKRKNHLYEFSIICSVVMELTHFLTVNCDQALGDRAFPFPEQENERLKLLTEFIVDSHSEPVMEKIWEFGVGRTALLSQIITEQEIEDIRTIIRAYLVPLGGFDKFEDKLLKDLERIQKEARETEEERAERLREEQARMLIKNRAKIDAWRSGKGASSRLLHSLPVMLRKRGSRIQTSHGAFVPLTEALELYKAYTEGQSIATSQIGPYTVSGVFEDIVKIGCHRIPLKEVTEFFTNYFNEFKQNHTNQEE